MNLVSYLFGRNYQKDPLCPKNVMEKALCDYSNMKTQGIHARLIIHRDWSTGALSLQVKDKKDIGFWTKLENFFFGTYALLNVKTVVERFLQTVANTSSKGSKQKIQSAIALLNTDLQAQYRAGIQEVFMPHKAPLGPVPHNIDRAKLQKLVSKHNEQLQAFEEFAAQNQWIMFRPEHSHYDWWVFPIIINFPNPSDTTREYAVTKEEIQELKKNPAFMERYKRGVDLVVQSWGWDLKSDRRIPEDQRKPDQQWTGYGVRLGKMMQSLRFFEERDLFQRLKHFFDEEGHKGLNKKADGWIFRGFRAPL